MFDEVVVAIGINIDKRGYFPTEKRMEIIRQATKDLNGVSIVKYDNLTVDVCRELDIHHIVRGVRNMIDFETERSIADANRRLAPDIDTVIIPTSQEYAHISSTAVRDILKHELYYFRGIQMVDLIHASRGCRFNCFPCCTPFLGGRRFRPRPIDAVVEEMAGIDNNRLFIVDNSLAQDDEWEKTLFREIAPLKKKWVSHPIKDDPEILRLAAEAGAWYVYQAIFDTSDYIRERVRRYKDHGIAVEGTIILGTDDQSLDDIRRLVDFLLEIDLDLAEFTVLTPFPHTAIRADLEREGRILHNDWIRYTAGEVVFRPAKMSVDELQWAYEYAWNTFYKDVSKEFRMAKLYLEVMKRERGDGSYREIRPTRRSWGVDAEGGK